ncbi:cytochrome P450 [Suillus cothurnatus]|nr:cytochrome P450 [Suillus cothurnatus]
MLQLPDLRVSDNTQLVLGTVAFLGVLVVGTISRAFLPKSESGLPLPPSPFTWRLRGHFIAPRNPFLTVAGWIDELGPLITIRSGTEKIVIIGRHDAVVDIMEKQGGSLADRPRLVAAGEILNGGLSVILTPSTGSMWRRMRRALHTHLQPKSAEEYQPLQMSHAKNMVLEILEDPANFQNHAASYAATTITKVAYGRTTPTSATDPEARLIRENFQLLRKTLRPGAYLVDMIPWLKYLPWYAQELKRGFERNRQLNTDQLNRVKRQISNVDIGPSFVKHMLENAQFHGLSETEMAFLAGSFYAAGFDTTTLAICTVLMAAACFPDEQAKVQAELDAVVGRYRVPTFADEQSLPQLHAFISEALRWRPLVPSGLAHRTTKEVRNYCIPAGTTVIGHHWSISRDPEVFPEPHAFKPQRWINDQGRLGDDLKFFVFGFGRRVCPGQHVATRSVFISSLLILWAFRLTLDATKSLDDMAFMRGENQLSFIEFKARAPETELRRMMQNDPDVV